MCILIGMGMFPRCAPPWRKIVLGVFLVIMPITLYLTASRGALIATILAALMYAFCLTLRKWHVIKIHFGKITISIALILAILISGTVIFWNQIEQTPLVDRSIDAVSSIMRGKIPDRISWWYSSLDMVKDKPLLGHGLSTFRDIYNQYRRVDYNTLEEDDMQDHITPEAAHNEYLNIAATQGILGLFSFLAIILFVYFSIFRATFKINETKDIALLTGIRGAILVYLIQIIMSFGVVSTMTYFFLLLGIGIALADSKVETRTFKLKGYKKFLVTIPLLVFISWGSFATIKSGILDYYYKEGLVNASQGNIAEAMNNFEIIVANKGHDYAYRQSYGDFALKASRFDNVNLEHKTKLIKLAIKQYEAAININHLHPSTYYNLGISQLQLSTLIDSDADFKKGAANLDLSIEKAPNNPLYPYQVGVAYMALGREDLNPTAVEYLKDTSQFK